MHTTKTSVLALAGLLLTAACASPQLAAASEAERAMAEADFERLKGLAGEWFLAGGFRLDEEMEAKPEEAFLSYSVSSGGHAVIEKLFVDQPREMTTVYYLAQGRLRMDHYCSLGNQPRMVAVPGSENEIAFQLVAVDNMPDKNDLHISSHSLEFPGPGELTVYWGATEGQEPSSGSMYRVLPLN